MCVRGLVSSSYLLTLFPFFILAPPPFRFKKNKPFYFAFSPFLHAFRLIVDEWFLQSSRVIDIFRKNSLVFLLFLRIRNVGVSPSESQMKAEMLSFGMPLTRRDFFFFFFSCQSEWPKRNCCCCWASAWRVESGEWRGCQGFSPSTWKTLASSCCCWRARLRVFFFFCVRWGRTSRLRSWTAGLGRRRIQPRTPDPLPRRWKMAQPDGHIENIYF